MLQTIDDYSNSICSDPFPYEKPTNDYYKYLKGKLEFKKALYHENEIKLNQEIDLLKKILSEINQNSIEINQTNSQPKIPGMISSSTQSNDNKPKLINSSGSSLNIFSTQNFVVNAGNISSFKEALAKLSVFDEKQINMALEQYYVYQMRIFESNKRIIQNLQQKINENRIMQAKRNQAYGIIMEKQMKNEEIIQSLNNLIEKWERKVNDFSNEQNKSKLFKKAILMGKENKEDLQAKIDELAMKTNCANDDMKKTLEDLSKNENIKTLFYMANDYKKGFKSDASSTANNLKTRMAEIQKMIDSLTSTLNSP